MPLTVTENALVGAVVEFSVSLYDSVRTVPAELTDALLIEAQAGDLFGVVSSIARFDTGTPMGWLQAVIELTLQRKDAGAELEAWLKGKYS